MKENNPLLSVIIAVYNRELFLAEAIDSVLAQTYSPVEIIVIDDGSDDPGTISLLAGLQKNKTTVFTIANAGVAAARNSRCNSA